MHTVLEQLKQIPIETQVEGIAYSKFNGKSNWSDLLLILSAI